MRATKRGRRKVLQSLFGLGWKRGGAGLLITDLVSAFRSWIDKGKEGNKKLAIETWEDKQRRKVNNE